MVHRLPSNAPTKHTAGATDPRATILLPDHVMSFTRRDFLLSAGALASASALGPLTSCAQPAESLALHRARQDDQWSHIRARFRASPEYIHLAGLLIASHPMSVGGAIAEHRSGLDENPTLYLGEHRRLEQDSRQAAAEYMGASAADIALTDSTTMGIGLVYNGIAVRPDQEMLFSRQDYYSTREALRYKAARTGANLREISLFERAAEASEDEIVAVIISAVTPRTRVVATTWVHSSTGLKFPVRRVADALADLNAERSPEDRALLCVDGVHGFGVENFHIRDLGCDFFMAGTHKWIFGPRGTGILWGRPESQQAVTPTIPSFNRDGTWGGAMSPGGFKPFEHQWAMGEAFRFHLEIGKQNVQQRIYELATQAKEGFAAMPHVQLYTPLEERLSSGIVCFDVRGMHPNQVVQRLLAHNVIASVTPYSPSHARVTPGLLNNPEEVDHMLRLVANMT
ncbi:aminotransferase class V-fold PLP-dependent enzyme [soil metagenome]